MVCGECGTRNLPGATFCVRCGGRVQAPPAPVEPPEPPPVSPADRQALGARELLEEGRVREAEISARMAAAVDPAAALPHLVLGEIRRHQGDLDEALRELRRAAELDPQLAEAREKAEQVRRQIAHPRSVHAGPLDRCRALLARMPRRYVPVIAGVAAGVLVFAVGAAAIVGGTSPTAQARRACERQMATGRQQYQAGRYAEAAEAFRQAQELDPSNLEARRRLEDAQRMAGQLPAAGVASAPPPTMEQRVAAADESATPGRTAFRSVWIGPTAPAAPATPTPNPQRPPLIPAPPPSHPSPLTPPDGRALPPLPPSGPPLPAANGEGDSRIGSEATGAAPAGSSSEKAVQPKPPQGTVTVELVPRPARAVPAPPQPATPQVSPAQVTRAEADRLRNSGRPAEAARRYAEAAAAYRAEAARGGLDAAAKTAAATSCERASKLCESQAH